MSATFVSDHTGWVLGCAGSCADDTSPLVVLRTHDAGQTWRLLPGPRSVPGSLFGLRFAGLDDGFAYGPAGLWSTHDAGATWRRVTGFGAVSALEAGHGHVWLLTQGAQLWRGAGGADVFRRVAEPQTEETLVLQHEAVFGSTYAGHGRSLLSYVAPGQPAGREGLPCTDDGVPLLAARTTRELFLVCADDGGRGDGSRSAWLSSDRGRTWARLAQPSSVGMRSLVAVTPAGLFIASDGGLLASHDDGRTWRSSIQIDGLVDLGFEGPELGFVIDQLNDAVMRVTRDDGWTWQTVDFRRTA